MRQKVVLIICHDFPYPLDYAGRIDTYNRVKALNDAGYIVHLIATVKNNVSKSNLNIISKICGQIYIIKRKFEWKSFLSMSPFQVKSRINDYEIPLIVSNLVNQKIEMLICDGYYGIGIAEALLKKINPNTVYLRVHNNEALYFKALSKSTSNIFKKIYYLSDSIKFLLDEKSLLGRISIDAFLHISLEEQKYYKFKFPEKLHYFLPAGIDVSKISPYERRENFSTIFIGSLFMPNNLEALYWYIKYVHDKLSINFPNYKLVVAGNTRGNIDKKLKFLMSENDNIVFIDTPENLDSVYKLGSVFINPMLNGAGVKLKSLNAICAGLPVVSSLVGNEGTGLLANEHLMVAKGVDEFYQMVACLFENESMRKSLVENSQKYIAKYYDQRSSFDRILANHKSKISS